VSHSVARTGRGTVWIVPNCRGIVLAAACGVTLMKIRHVIGLAVALIALAAAPVARAEDGPRVPPWAIRLEPGAFFMPDHLHAYGLVGVPPPAYVGISVERAIAGPFRANVSGGASPLLGWLVGGTIRYVVVDAETGATVSIGAGPLFAPNADFGAAAFAQVDVTLQWQIAGSFGVVLGGSLGIALNHARALNCGVDTCEAYLARGDTVGSLRVGIGWAF
jgi:hypothetical protein